MRFILCALAALACSKDIHTRYPSHALGDATVVIRFTNAITDAWVSIDGVPVAEGVHTKQITVTNVPAGERFVVVAAGGGVEKAFTVKLREGQRAVVPLAAPDTSFGKSLLQVIGTVIVYAAYMAIAEAI